MTTALARTRQRFTEHRWLALALLALVALVLGVWGGHGSFLDRLYVAIQLFPLNGSTSGKETAAFQIARFLAPALFLYATLRAIYSLFQERFQTLRAHFKRDHVVVCGLGRQGSQVVRTFLADYDVVAVERNPENPAMAVAREAGAIVVLGDATDPAVLRRARIDRARRAVVVCGRDAVNAEVAIRLGEAKGPSTKRLPALVHLEDARLYSLLVHRMRTESGVWIDFFNVFDRGARAILDEYPPFEAGRARHILVVGLGRLGQALVAHAAHEWFKRAQHEEEGDRLKVSVVDRAANVKTQALQNRYSQLARVCDLRPYEMDAESAEFDRLLNANAELTDLSAAFVCFDDDARSVGTALSLAQHGRDRLEVVVARVADPQGGLALLLRDHQERDDRVRLEPLSLSERTCRADIVRQGVLDLLAQEIHETYLRSGVTGPSARPWQNLVDEERERNILHAEAIKSQLEAVGLRLGPLLDWGAPLEEIPKEELQELAMLEHNRWMTERRAAGWKPGPNRDDLQKLHPDLIPWNELPENRRQIDRDLIAERPAMLARIGIGLYRARRPLEEGSPTTAASGTPPNPSLSAGP